MGLFGDVGKFFSKTVAPAIATGGLSLVPGVKDVLKPFTNVVSTVAGLQLDPRPLISAATNFGASYTRGGVPAYTPADLAAIRAAQGTQPTVLTPGVDPMALNLPAILGSVGTIFGGNQNPVFNTVSNVANLASQFFPSPAARLPVVQQPAPIVATAAPAMRAGAMVARGFFNKFPNLALSLQQLRARGIQAKRSHLWSLLKRFGPEALVAGGLLTAAAVNELMLAGPGRRQMNAANAKALRRAARRIRSFHKLCSTIDLLKSRSRRPCKTPRGSGAQFVRQG